MPIYVLGHTNPDSDSICAAISLSYLLKQIGKNSIASRQGECSDETKFILEKFGFEEPLLKKSYAGEDLFLVDFSDLNQAPADIDKANILGIVDHHKLGDITTPVPLECWIRPVGCTNTIIKEMFDYYGINIPEKLSAIMLCAILSDTVIYKSPTCTSLDIKISKELAKIAKINDIKALGMEMFMVKSSIKGASAKELITRDYKDFNMSSCKVGIGQLESVDLSIFKERKEELLQEMSRYKNEGERDCVLLLLTDIINEGSELLAVCEDDTIIEKAFGKKLKNSSIYLPGVLSRKKQVVPFLEKAYKG